MAVVCPVCDTPLTEVLHGEVAQEVQEQLMGLHEADAVKIDHVRRGDPQECWACKSSTKGFHLYKAGGDFIKLCDDCAQHVATFLAHLVSDRRGVPGTEEEPVSAGTPDQDSGTEAGEQAGAADADEPEEADAGPDDADEPEDADADTDDADEDEEADADTDDADEPEEAEAGADDADEDEEADADTDDADEDEDDVDPQSDDDAGDEEE